MTRDLKSGGLIFKQSKEERTQMSMIRENKKLKKDIDFIKKELEGLKEMITNINKVEEK